MPVPAIPQSPAIPEPAPPATSPSIPTLQPTHRIAFPGSTNIYSVALSPDGRTAYCLIEGRGIDLWAAGLTIWPELLGGLTGLVLLLWAAIAFRITRRPQLRGQPHCRKCNYNVISQAPDSAKRGSARALPRSGTLCPECGVDLSRKRPRRGRSTFRRLWIPTAFALLILGGYATLFAIRLPRTGPISQRFGLWSTWVDDLAEKHQISWLIKQRTRVFRIVRVDTHAGTIGSVLRTRRDYPVTEMLMAPDGRHLAYGEMEGLVCWISTTTGLISTSTFGGTFSGSHNTPYLIGFDGPPDDPRLYYAALDQSDQTSRLWRWNPSSGAQQCVIAEPAYPWHTPNGTVSHTIRKYALLHWPNGTATLSAPDFIEWYDTKRLKLTVREPLDIGGKVLRSIDIAEQHAGSSSIVANADGSAVFLSAMTGGIVGVDPRSGERIGALHIDMYMLANDELAHAPVGSWLFISAYPHDILVRDTTTRRWVADLVLPEPFIAPKLYVSPNARWLAATPFQSNGGVAPRGPYIRELFLFDLSSLDQTPTPPAPNSR